MASIQHLQTQSRLIQLPAEARNRIYGYILTVEPNSDGRVVFKRSTLDRTQPRTVLSILQTCRQIHAEAEAIFFHDHHLQMTNLHTSYICPTYCPSSLSKTRQSAIRFLTITVYSDAPEQVSAFFEHHHALKNLQVLHIHYCGTHYWTWDRDSDRERFLAAMHSFRNALPNFEDLAEVKFVHLPTDGPLSGCPMWEKAQELLMKHVVEPRAKAVKETTRVA